MKLGNILFALSATMTFVVGASSEAGIPTRAMPSSLAIERGYAIATRSGCLSCHGAGLIGRAKINDPSIAILYASNLTRVRAQYTDAQLARTIRTATRPDGSRLWFMAAPYASLSEADMADLIAYIRSVPTSGVDYGRIRMGPRFIKAVQAKRIQPEALEQATDHIVPPDFGPRFARGRYLSRTICAGCHYPSLNGQTNPQAGDAPNLTVAAAYDEAEFRTLLRTGVATGHRQVGVMSEESPKRFAHLSDADIDAIRTYLVKRAQNWVSLAPHYGCQALRSLHGSKPRDQIGPERPPTRAFDHAA